MSSMIHPIPVGSFSLYKARRKFEHASNRTFTYEDFSYNVVRVFFDQLHHVKTNEISLSDALELMIFCNYEGQLDQKSDFETRLYDELCEKITENIEDRKHLCLIWMFLRSCSPSGNGTFLIDRSLFVRNQS